MEKTLIDLVGLPDYFLVQIADHLVSDCAADGGSSKIIRHGYGHSDKCIENEPALFCVDPDFVVFPPVVELQKLPQVVPEGVLDMTVSVAEPLWISGPVEKCDGNA